MRSSSLHSMLNQPKTTSPQKQFPSDCIHLYMKNVIIQKDKITNNVQYNPEKKTGLIIKHCARLFNNREDKQIALGVSPAI